MKRIYQILSIGFLALVLFLNIGLTLNLRNGLHAHILDNNRILIHFHHTTGGEHSHNNNPDCGSSSFVFSSTLTYLNNSQGFTIKSSCVFFHKEELILKNNITQKQHLYTYPRRGPPVVQS